jgi:lipoprotein-releasing system ATP-binding protein
MSDALIAASGRGQGLPHRRGLRPRIAGLDLAGSRPGEMLAITGASGVGQVHTAPRAGHADPPESGTITVAGEDVLRLPEPRLRAFRNQTMGFVFQFHHLLPSSRR